jgi:hypothetical protein
MAYEISALRHLFRGLTPECLRLICTQARSSVVSDGNPTSNAFSLQRAVIAQLAFRKNPSVVIDAFPQSFKKSPPVTHVQSPPAVSFLRSACRRFGIWFSPSGNDVSHPVHQERFGRPGATLLGSDSHTPGAGAIGMMPRAEPGFITCGVRSPAYRVIYSPAGLWSLVRVGVVE